MTISDIELRILSAVQDLPVLFTQQLDEEANQMAAFTKKDPSDRDAFNTHWDRILNDDSITLRTILFKEQIAGYVVCHDWFGEPEVSYWIGKEFWGRGVATEALCRLLQLVENRPLLARVAKDNIGSIRVLEKCGFEQQGEDKGYSNARQKEVEEYLFVLK